MACMIKCSFDNHQLTERALLRSPQAESPILEFITGEELFNALEKIEKAPPSFNATKR